MGLAETASRPMQPNPATIRAVLINMERWRWLPHDLGAYYVTVNIPEFMLRVVEDDKQAYTTRVVVGKPDKQTPIFSNQMQEIVFGPFWKRSRKLDPIYGKKPRGSAAGAGILRSFSATTCA